MDKLITALTSELATVAEIAAAFGIDQGTPLTSVKAAIKTIGQYSRQLRRAVLEFWRGDTDAFGFIDAMTAAIDNQLRRAWREGMRDVGLDPTKDADASIDTELEKRIADEINSYVIPFAEAIQKARTDGSPIDPLYSRVDMWVNRYNDIKNAGALAYSKEERLEWVLGATEHCGTCQSLSGIIAFGHVWSASPWRPQGHNLECGGYRCQCALQRTDRRPTDRQPIDVR